GSHCWHLARPAAPSTATPALPVPSSSRWHVPDSFRDCFVPAVATQPAAPTAPDHSVIRTDSRCNATKPPAGGAVLKSATFLAPTAGLINYEPVHGVYTAPPTN